MRLKIPSGFQILGHKISVATSPVLNDYASAEGLYLHRDKTIVLQEGLKDTYMMQTLMHEIMHCILEHMGESALSDNEDFVDKMAEALHQILTTWK